MKYKWCVSRYNDPTPANARSSPASTPGENKIDLFPNLFVLFFISGCSNIQYSNISIFKYFRIFKFVCISLFISGCSQINAREVVEGRNRRRYLFFMDWFLFSTWWHWLWNEYNLFQWRIVCSVDGTEILKKNKYNWIFLNLFQSSLLRVQPIFASRDEKLHQNEGRLWARLID